MKTLTFNNKAEYLQWRAQWRADYAELAKNIREYKAMRKTERGDMQAHAQSRCYFLRNEAREMLELRAKSKIKAQEQYGAAKSQPASA